MADLSDNFITLNGYGNQEKENKHVNFVHRMLDICIKLK
jgi:hypothetical protein